MLLLTLFVVVYLTVDQKIKNENNDMKVYQEITLQPSPEIPQNFIWEKLFQQIHMALVDTKISHKHDANGKEKVAEYSEYGLSFTNYNSQINALGCQLRVFSDGEKKMERLNLSRWLERLLDYCKCSTIQTVPTVTQFSRFQRRQFVTNIEHMARRRSKRKHETLEKARSHYADFNIQLTRLPFIYVQSLSSEKRFRLFIEQEIVSQEKTGSFSCYGLSKQATVPWF